jgi:hypothetical protein
LREGEWDEDGECGPEEFLGTVVPYGKYKTVIKIETIRQTQGREVEDFIRFATFFRM